MSTLSISAISPILAGELKRDQSAMSLSATWSKAGGFGRGEVRDVTPNSVILSGVKGAIRGERISVQIKWSGGVYVVAGKVAAPSRVLGGLRIELDRPDASMFATLWGNLS